VSERPHFIVHNPGDSVGVVVVEDVKAGQELTGWVMADDATIKLTVQADVPLGHKVATKPLAKDDTVVEYEHEIGRAVEDIPVGGYVHAHNIKTKRW
jgi:(2R)-sulfolactate sulfo-lyase subunit alpha